jgi:hypothetical protein
LDDQLKTSRNLSKGGISGLKKIQEIFIHVNGGIGSNIRKDKRKKELLEKRNYSATKAQTWAY